jgi:hypothetical protein
LDLSNYPQSGVLLTSFSTWGKENGLVEINLESTGVIKGCNIFWGQKLQLYGQAHYHATRKSLESRTQLDEPVRVEKNYQYDLDAGPLEFQFLRPRGCLTNPFRTLLLCFGVIRKTPGLISLNNFVKKNFCLHWPSR